MNAQELFDFVVAKLRAQGAPSFDTKEDFCVYRGASGVKCAAGHLIPDEMYDESLEGVLADELKLQAIWDSIGVGEHTNLIRHLQLAHDQHANNGHTNAHWRQRFEKSAKQVAKDFDLKYTEPA